MYASDQSPIVNGVPKEFLFVPQELARGRERGRFSFFSAGFEIITVN